MCVPACGGLKLTPTDFRVTGSDVRADRNTRILRGEVLAYRFGFFVRHRVVGVVFSVLVVAPFAAAVPGGAYPWPGESGPAMQRLIVDEARATGVVPAALALAVAKEASDFNHRVVSAAGEIGVMQIAPVVAAREYGVSADELWDPVINVRVGLQYLSHLYRVYSGDWELVLSHFRGGPLLWSAGRYRPHHYTDAYVDRVTRWWRRYRWDPTIRFPIRRGHEARPFAESLRGYEVPRFSAGAPRFTNDQPTRDRWRSPWIAVTGGGRFR